MFSPDAFLQALREAPDDDLPRLIYADWLEEHGDADRAEFIRVQVRLAGLDEEDPERPALEDRERALLAAHEAEWLGPLPPDVAKVTFRRGFVNKVVLGAPPDLAALGEFCARHAVRKLVFLKSAAARELARWPVPAGVVSLDLRCWRAWSPTLVEGVITSSHLAGLTALALQGGIDDDFVAALVASPLLRQLEALRLDTKDLTDAGLARLLRSPHLDRLTKLDLRTPRLTGSILVPLTNPPLAARWTELTWLLNITSNSYSPASVARLGACVNLRKLRLLLPARPLVSFPTLPGGAAPGRTGRRPPAASPGRFGLPGRAAPADPGLWEVGHPG